MKDKRDYRHLYRKYKYKYIVQRDKMMYGGANTDNINTLSKIHLEDIDPNNLPKNFSDNLKQLTPELLHPVYSFIYGNESLKSKDKRDAFVKKKNKIFETLRKALTDETYRNCMKDYETNYKSRKQNAGGDQDPPRYHDPPHGYQQDRDGDPIVIIAILLWLLIIAGSHAPPPSL